mmetsp:Transcript_14032/g.35166  ORF Transcript_14032/g.35166 Transcript_14032/m.35166 type:complete len:359 (+) Transcript_14032:42-1118(+)
MCWLLESVILAASASCGDCRCRCRGGGSTLLLRTFARFLCKSWIILIGVGVQQVRLTRRSCGCHLPGLRCSCIFLQFSEFVVVHLLHVLHVLLFVVFHAIFVVHITSRLTALYQNGIPAFLENLEYGRPLTCVSSLESKVLPPPCHHRSLSYCIGAWPALRRHRVVRQRTTSPVAEHETRRGCSVWNATTAKLASRTRNCAEERFDVRRFVIRRRGVVWKVVMPHELKLGTPRDHLFDSRARVSEPVIPHRTVKNSGVLRKHDTRRVEQCDILVQVNFLRVACNAGNVSHLRDARSLQRVDERRLAHVGHANNTDGDGRLCSSTALVDASAPRVVLEQLKQRIHAECRARARAVGIGR